jgi:hypothetical protein
MITTDETVFRSAVEAVAKEAMSVIIDWETDTKRDSSSLMGSAANDSVNTLIKSLRASLKEQFDDDFPIK